jgi:AraC-like DNA-binding protein
MTKHASTHGILRPEQGFTRFALDRVPASPALAPFVDWFWIVRWDLEAPFAQEVLPHPCVNLVIERDKSAVHGPANARFVASLEGKGRVVGTKFKPEGFAAFSRVPMKSLVDGVVSIGDAIDASLASLTSLEDHEDEAEIVRTLEAALLARSPRLEPAAREVGQLVTTALTDRSITRAEQLATMAGTSVRSLQRVFERVVGLGPKWILRRSRVHEAAERVRGGESVEWARLASDLGYHDQSHLIRDFKDQVGFTPAAYAARCAEALRTEAPSSAGSATRSPSRPPRSSGSRTSHRSP